jgi:hypothetical protein
MTPTDTMTPTDERIYSLLAAVPPGDRLPDGMPTPEALERIAKSLSPIEQKQVAEREIYRVSKIYLELLTAIGAAERLDDDNYKKLREVTPQEDEAIRVLIEGALNGPGDNRA